MIRPRSQAGAQLVKGSDSSTSNNLWVKGLQANPDDFWDIWQTYERTLYRHCFFNIANKNHHDAEDLCSDTMLKAYEKLSYTDPNAKILGWLFRVSRNIYFDQIRRKTTQEKYMTDQEGYEDAGENVLLYQESNKKKALFIASKVKAIKGDERHMLFDRIFKDKSYREISEHYGVFQPQIRKVVHRHRKSIKQSLERLMPD